MVVPDTCLKINVEQLFITLNKNDSNRKILSPIEKTYDEINDIATGTTFNVFPPRIYSFVLFCLCLEKKA